jgi:hypothetical protein
MTALERFPTFQDHKSLVDFMHSLSIINNIYAQNVLAHYQISFFKNIYNYLKILLACLERIFCLCALLFHWIRQAIVPM